MMRAETIADRAVCLRVDYGVDDIATVENVALMFVDRTTDLTGIGPCWIFHDPAVAQRFIDTVHQLYRSAGKNKPEFAQVQL